MSQQANPSVTFKPATIEDFDFVWRLYRDLMKDLTEDMVGWREDKQHALILSAVAAGSVDIIMIEGQCAGWLETDEDDEALYLHQIYVAPEFQGRGLGSEIMRGLLAEARAKRKPVRLSVMRNNAGAKRLYQRLGFEVIGQDDEKYHLESGAEG